MPYEIEQDLEHVLEHTRPVWAELTGANIFITGGTRFVGVWLLESFCWARRRLNLNSNVFVLSRNPDLFLARNSSLAGQPGLTVLKGDARTFTFPAEEMQFVIHAAITHGNVVAENTAGTQRVLEMAKNRGSQRLLYISSGAVYGPQPDDLANIAEDFAGAAGPATSYASAKRESELLCLKALNSELAVIIARLFAFVGPHLPLDQNFAAGNFVRDALAGGPIRIEGDGSPVRSYLYAADLAIWLWTLLVNGNPGRAYNVGSDAAVSILQLASAVENICAVKTGINVARERSYEAKPSRYVPSIARARTEFGLRPWVSLEDGIERMFTWCGRRVFTTP